MYDKEKELAALRRQQQRESRGRIDRDTKDRLKRIAHKKFRTCFIHAIAEFEEHFGEELWGHNLSENQLTHEHIQNRSIWEQVRKSILDNGNAQSRAIAAEIDLHDVHFSGYHLGIGRRTDG